MFNPANAHMGVLAGVGFSLMGLSVPGRRLAKLGPVCFVAGLALIVWAVFQHGAIAETVLVVVVVVVVALEQPHFREYLPTVSAPKRRLSIRWPRFGRSFTITEATYGVGDRTLDAEPRITARIKRGHVDFIADNESMGGDPAPGTPKILIVRWRSRGKEYSSSFNEGTHVALPDD